MKKFRLRWDSIGLIVLIIEVLVSILFSVGLINTQIMPMKYILLIIFVLTVLIVLSAVFIQKKRTKKIKVIGYIVTALLLIITGVGTYYLSIATDFLNKAFKESKDTYTNTYQILVKEDANYNNIEDIKDTVIGYYTSIPNVEDALKEIDKKINYEKKSYEDIIENFNDLNKEKISAILIENNLYDSLKEASLDILNNKEYKSIYSFDITFEQEVIKKQASGNGINIYIGGPDFTGTNYDFNMIATVNKNTHKILLTSTPRDFYVTVAGKGMKDLLGYAGVWGINTSIGTIEDLYGIDMNYFIKINTSSLVGLVDVLGGVQFCSDRSFTTTHALVQGTYDDTKGPKLNVQKGCKDYSGIEILTIARERIAFPGGDRQRQKNCQDIIINIFNKVASLKSITNLNQILDKVSNLYSTNMPKEFVTDIAKGIIDGEKWNFEQQSVTGTDSRGKVHLGTVEDYVMLPNSNSVDKAKLKIKEVMNES